ncbi:MAG: hypothetical protein AAF039_07945 [Bacteroidota bacterium]
MKKIFILYAVLGLSFSCKSQNPDFKINAAEVHYDRDLDQFIFKITVEGEAGRTTPSAIGQLDGAPVDGYVFPTSLKAEDVGFGKVEGVVALALTSHPDFDDTPLWDENKDSHYDNDGIVWHPHWVVLVEDTRVQGGLSVKQFDQKDSDVVLPPTNPGMPMYMDSPGYPVITENNSIAVVVPGYRIKTDGSFRFDGVAAYMQVNTSKEDMPMLGVYEVYSIASGDLSLPYTVNE